MAKYIKEGAYGRLSVYDDKAVKKFKKLSHMVKEYGALQYLSDCPHVVKAKGVDFSTLEITLEVYECDLLEWYVDGIKRSVLQEERLLLIIRDFLLGIMEIHDRGMIHGDIKPSNILININPLSAVIGDCGLTSLSKYVKVNSTADTFRDPNPHPDIYHDMYSIGVTLLILFSKRIMSTNEVRKMDVLDHARSNTRYNNLIYRLVQKNRDKRPNVREVLFEIFQDSFPKYKITIYDPHISEKVKKRVSQMVKSYTEEDEKIYGKRNGIYSLANFLTHHGNLLDDNDLKCYIIVVLFIVTSIYGNNIYREDFLEYQIKRLPKNYSISKVITKLMKCDGFINIMYEKRV